jgi:hypothetical protein
LHRLSAYLSRYTDRPIGLAIGASYLKEIFDETFYNESEGGLLGGLGQLFGRPIRSERHWTATVRRPNGRIAVFTRCRIVQPIRFDRARDDSPHRAQRTLSVRQRQKVQEVLRRAEIVVLAREE